MKTKLITALRTAAYALESGTFYYKWAHASNCNCGVVVSALLGKSSDELAGLLPPPPTGDTSWTARVGVHCPVTGIPNHAMLRELQELGLTPKDIVDLEWLRNKEVLARIPRATVPHWFGPDTKEPVIHTNRRDLILYLRAWADLLVERGVMDVANVSDAKSQENVKQ